MVNLILIRYIDDMISTLILESCGVEYLNLCSSSNSSTTLNYQVTFTRPSSTNAYMVNISLADAYNPVYASVVQAAPSYSLRVVDNTNDPTQICATTSDSGGDGIGSLSVSGPGGLLSSTTVKLAIRITSRNLEFACRSIRIVAYDGYYTGIHLAGFYYFSHHYFIKSKSRLISWGIKNLSFN